MTRSDRTMRTAARRAQAPLRRPRVGIGMMAAVPLLAACAVAPGLPESVFGPSPAPAQACDVEASALWATNEAGTYTAVAAASGPLCASAELTLQIEDAGGSVLWTDRHNAQQLFGFGDVATPAQMREALVDWVTQAAGFSRSADLPAWPAGAVQPANASGFVFAPIVGLPRPTYERLRAAATPLFCYVQGRESVFCLTLAAGEKRVIPLGAQTFPG